MIVKYKIVRVNPTLREFMSKVFSLKSDIQLNQRNLSDKMEIGCHHISIFQNSLCLNGDDKVPQQHHDLKSRF